MYIMGFIGPGRGFHTKLSFFKEGGQVRLFSTPRYKTHSGETTELYPAPDSVPEAEYFLGNQPPVLTRQEVIDLLFS